MWTLITLSSKVYRRHGEYYSSRSDQISVRREPRAFAPEIWSESVDEEIRCLSEASFGPSDVFASNLATVTHGANVGVAFSLVTFFWRSKRKFLPRGMSAIVDSLLMYSLRMPPSPSPLKGEGTELRSAWTTSTLTRLRHPLPLAGEGTSRASPPPSSSH